MRPLRPATPSSDADVDLGQDHRALTLRTAIQVVMPCLQPQVTAENPWLTICSGTRRARSRLRRPLLRSSEFGALPPWTRSLIPRMAKIIPRIFRIMDTSAVTARTLQGIARVRSAISH